ncbi:hydroxypyruvate isomerase family protein [Kutzneria sp. 744]|uniref:hydroxypyruvate isomerase family protein n=1 Tax=Kutzneria sp. (strain 744) TaxID=345341 RepID=UPI0003EEE025|nr:TIM barrel protein [Kutzneria sp. 744]EWM19577.1 hydroxypyruvate isomerase [Kutzneria sp. 744]
MLLDANLSILFTELPLLERPAAAAKAGFDAVEFWWPFDTANPTPAQVDAFVDALDTAGVKLVGLNFFAGDMPAGDRGVVSWPGRQTEFNASVEIAVDIARRTGCRTFNALYGNRIAGFTPSEQDELATANLTVAATAVQAVGGTIVLEPLSGAPDYPLLTAADALAVADRVPLGNVALLCDLYHLAVNGDDLDSVTSKHIDRIGHVQFADAPGRGEPGSGQLELLRHLTTLSANGYRGHVGAEYRPTGATADSFGWLPTFQKEAS